MLGCSLTRLGCMDVPMSLVGFRSTGRVAAFLMPFVHAFVQNLGLLPVVLGAGAGSKNQGGNGEGGGGNLHGHNWGMQSSYPRDS